MNESESQYALLQVDPAAEPEVIESAYHRLARKYHPDVNGSPEAAERMRAINLAYATLSNPGRRAIYDRERRRASVGQRLRRVQPIIQPSRRGAVPAGGLVQAYQSATQPLQAQAVEAVCRWAAAWADALDAIASGDGRARETASEAGHHCLTELGDCLARWEANVPPPEAQRLADLGAACLKLQIALVRGTLSLAEDADFSVLGPLGGLAERIEALSLTIAAEATIVSRIAA